MLNQFQKIELVLVGIIAFLAVLSIFTSRRSESYYYDIGQSLTSVCDKQVNAECQAALEASQKASPDQYPLVFQKYKQCLKSAYKKCGCEGEGRKKVLDSCFESLRNTKAFERGSRTFGCYALKNKAEKTACFENPYKYLCAQPDSMACQEIKMLCDIDAIC